jgi:transmembrane sensor
MSNGRGSMESRISDQVAEEAGYWDARLRSPDCTGADRARFAEWRDASPEHREAFERLQTIFAGLRRNIARAEVRALRDEALGAEKSPSARRRAFAAAAAGVAALAVAATLWTNFPDHLQRQPWSESLALAESWLGLQRSEIYETGIGQRSISTLQDGSSVELDAGTRVRVVMSKRARDVELLYGQALFHVAHDAARPFVVRAADREITALGTQFDVRLDGTSVRVTLIEGKVKVSSEPSQSAAYLVPGQQLIARLPGAHEKVVGSAVTGGRAGGLDVSTLDGDAQVRTVDIGKVTGWRDGRIFLEDLSLADAVAEMNRHSPVQISIADPQIASLRVNGMFRAGEPRAFVDALEQYFPIAAQDYGDTQIVLSQRR